MRNRFTSFTFLLLALVVSLGLSACGGTGQKTVDAPQTKPEPVSVADQVASDYTAFNKTLPDGRVASCVAWRYTGSGGGIDCDFPEKK